MDVIEYKVIDSVTREKSSFLIEESLSEQIDNMIVYFTLLDKHISWTHRVWSSSYDDNDYIFNLIIKDSIKDHSFMASNSIGFSLKGKSEIITKDYAVALTKKNNGNAIRFTLEEAIEKLMELY